MERRYTDTECALYGTKSCALLNMQDCDHCPLKGRIADPAIHDDLKLFCELQPEGTVAQLFESETCTLCKDEPKGKADCYAIFDMAHEEPKMLAKRKWLTKETTGFMVPLQFACCKKCRRRILLGSYLPLIAPILLTLAVLPFVSIPKMSETLLQIASWLPLLIVFVAIVGGYGVGKLLAYLWKKRSETYSYVDVRTHPFVAKMAEKGWRPLFGDRAAHVAFTRKRIERGLGTAGSAVYGMEDEKPEAKEDAPVEAETEDVSGEKIPD